MRREVLGAGILALVCGCATLDGDETSLHDPWEGFNRASFGVSDAIDRAALKPVARGYAALLPAPLESAVRNFFDNLRVPFSAVNGFLQAKPGRGVRDLSRFLLNSTVGLFGTIDVADRVGIESQDEDLGQTLAVWGYRRSRALYVPVLGPTTVRDLPGMLIDRVLAPRWLLGDRYGWEVAALDAVSQRASALTLTDARDATALDPYAFTMAAYHQRRLNQIWDGAPPTVDLLDEFDIDDE